MSISRALWFVIVIPAFCCVAHGCANCDPDAHIFVTNNYSVPVKIHHLINPQRNMPDQILDTVAPGKRIELAANVALDGDVDNLQVEDQSGTVLERLKEGDSNVVCKKKSPEYVWEITVGPHK